MSKSIRGIIIFDDKVLMIKRIKKGSLYYVFPGGHKEKSESEIEACKREVKEETNLDVKPIKKLFTLVEGNSHRSIYYFCEMRNNVEELPEVRLNGEEIGRLDKGNYYEPMWVDITELNTLTIYPKAIVPIILNF